VATRLGELLVQSGACTPAAVREALENQVIFGGRLGTNLLELGLVEEEPLARALGSRHGVPHLWGPTALDPAAVRLVPAELADRWEIVPYVLSDRRLAILACDPSNLGMLDEVAFSTGKHVHALVAPEARVWAHLRAAYGLVRQLRGIAFEYQPEAPPGAPAAAAPAAPAVDLMDEAGFAALYARDRPEAPRAAPAVPPGAAAPPDDDVIELTEELAELPPLAAPPPPEREPGPLGFEEAVAALDGVTDRAAIARTVLRYARNRLRRAVLFTVHRGVAQGWVGLGEGLAPRHVQAIRLALGSPGVLDTVVRTRSHYLGPLPRTEANIRLLKALGGGVPGNALLVPILALGRVVNVIYADGGRGALVDAGGVGELLILASRIAQSYQKLLERI
jgi:hypothetical protein